MKEHRWYLHDFSYDIVLPLDYETVSNHNSQIDTQAQRSLGPVAFSFSTAETSLLFFFPVSHIYICMKDKAIQYISYFSLEIYIDAISISSLQCHSICLWENSIHWVLHSWLLYKWFFFLNTLNFSFFISKMAVLIPTLKGEFWKITEDF